jgi:superfamily II DNA or RNA helicase
MFDDLIKNTLYDFQIEHLESLVKVIQENITCLDSSDTGTGKTYTALALCRHLDLQPIIICPKSLIYNWQRVAKLFQVKPILITNYEKLSKETKYLVKKENTKIIENKYEKQISGKYNLLWNIKTNKNTIFIFDEVHRCTNINTFNAQLLYYTKITNNHVLLLSATIADIPEKFRLFSYILNFIDPKYAKDTDLSFGKYILVYNRWIMRDARPMFKLHTMLFPSRASRMRISALSLKMPENLIIAEPYTLTDKRAEEIQKSYLELNKSIISINKKSNNSGLTNVLRLQQKIEILKVPTFIELAKDFIENNMSVVIFVNFKDTLFELAKLLETKCLIYGELSSKIRDKNVQDFLENKERIIICTVKTGGIGLSLHDTTGNYPRVSLISPTWNSVELLQVLGRIYRINTKSRVQQRIIYIADTVEQDIAEKLKLKLLNINTINNGDLDLSDIKFEKERKNI